MEAFYFIAGSVLKENAMREREAELRLNMCSIKMAPVLLLLSLFLIAVGGCASRDTMSAVPESIPLLASWSGDYPLAELGRLPDGQHSSTVGYIGDAQTFNRVWQVFMPAEDLPVVDFRKNIVVFTRNIQFYNRTSIFRVELQEGTAEILAMETMSSMPIDDKVAMAMAVIARDGVLAVKSDTHKIDVAPHK